MAEASISEGYIYVHHFSCPVCLDLLNHPVIIPCGHSFCKLCINGCWDQDDVKGIYSCPQCRETFTPRPVLYRNNMLAEVLEKLKKTELQAASPAVSAKAERTKKQSFPSLCVSPGCDDSPSFTVNQHLSFYGVRKSLSDLKKRVKQFCEKKFNKIRPQGEQTNIGSVSQ
ncbi:E3 ubiquitin-protein ligase TRIM11-like [Tachysurus fulvidraco]|uniref:E3 ubiquitin-protein ligase TRIM11-like n=1 Tax=Tachysurus fulvidraco TaxID=1234273 RepID=UPI001FEF5B06|nr:E3 ubiquitin-protein ligase TRIM11-like [Tachysurus fulvidraco]